MRTPMVKPTSRRSRWRCAVRPKPRVKAHDESPAPARRTGDQLFDETHWPRSVLAAPCAAGMEHLATRCPRGEERVIAEPVGVAECRPAFGLAADLADGRVEVDDHLARSASRRRPGPRRSRRARRRVGDWPKVKARRKVPSVDGAITRCPSTEAVAPERSTSAWSMWLPPATMACTKVSTLRPGTLRDTTHQLALPGLSRAHQRAQTAAGLATGVSSKVTPIPSTHAILAHRKCLLQAPTRNPATPQAPATELRRSRVTPRRRLKDATTSGGNPAHGAMS